MSILFLDSEVARDLIRGRQELGQDRYDEVWEGVYVVSPLPNNDHQRIVWRLCSIFNSVTFDLGLGEALPGANVSDRVQGWEHNFRGPDVVVFLKGTKAVDHGTHWVGGPDFVVEVISKNDRSREKLEFYEKVETREVLLVDRYPWSLELHRLVEGKLVLVGRSSLEEPIALVSQVLPLEFRLVEGEARPMIEVRHRDGVQRWTI